MTLLRRLVLYNIDKQRNISNNSIGGFMNYKVHRIDVKADNMQEKLEKFLNDLDGEVLSIVPNVRPTFQLMGAAAKIDYLLAVEKK